MGIVLLTGKSQDDDHVHRVVLSAREVDVAKAGRAVLVETEETNGHSHEMTIKFSYDRYIMTSCDGGRFCFDKHSRNMAISSPEDVDGVDAGMM